MEKASERRVFSADEYESSIDEQDGTMPESGISVIGKIQDMIDNGSIPLQDFFILEDFYVQYRKKYPVLEQKCAQLIHDQCFNEIEHVNIKDTATNRLRPSLATVANSISNQDFYYWVHDILCAPDCTDLAEKKLIEYFSTANNYDTVLGSLGIMQRELYSIYASSIYSESSDDTTETKNPEGDPVHQAVINFFDRAISDGAIVAAEQIATSIFLKSYEMFERKSEVGKDFFFEALEQRVQLARNFSLFESVVSGAKDLEEIKNFFTLPEAQQIPIDIKTKMNVIAEGYFEKRKNAHDVYSSLCTEAGIGGQPVDSARIGAYAFKKKTSADPTSQVSLEIQEGYIVINFLSRQDYLTYVEERNQGSIGLYHRAMDFVLSSGSVKASVVLVDCSQGYADTKNTSIHERQHFINDTLNFSDLEKFHFISAPQVKKRGLRGAEENAREYGHDTLMKVAARRMKDETLAFLREGCQPASMQEILKYSYKHIRQGLSRIDNVLLDSIITETAKKLETKELDLFLRNRALLVYLLVDVPFDLFPSFLGRLIEYRKPIIQREEEEKENMKKRLQDFRFKSYLSTMSVETKKIADDL